MQQIARRAVLSFPWLAELQIVRAWAALRVMPPDGLPIYDEFGAIPRRLHRQLPQRRHPGGAHANVVRADGRRRRARPDAGAVFRQALRCSGTRPDSPAGDDRGRGRGARRPGAGRRLGGRGGADRRARRASATRRSAAAARAPYCMMGVCFDCLAEIDGMPNRQSCMVAAAPGHAHPPPARRPRPRDRNDRERSISRSSAPGRRGWRRRRWPPSSASTRC